MVGARRLEISPLLIIFGVTAVMFGVLVAIQARKRRGQNYTDAGEATEIGIAGLLSVNIAGMLGLVWFVASILVYDGVMIVELGICAVLIAVLALTTGGALALKHRRKTTAAAALLSVAALPTIAVYAFLLYLGIHPIDMR